MFAEAGTAPRSAPARGRVLETRRARPVGAGEPLGRGGSERTEAGRSGGGGRVREQPPALGAG